MSFYLKDPQSRVECPMAWDAGLLGAAAIVGSGWTAEPAGLTIEDAGVGGAVTRVTIGGGQTGMVYRLANRVTLSDGRSDVRSILIRVEPR